MCHILPFALYSDIQNLLVSASAIRHCAVAQASLQFAHTALGLKPQDVQCLENETTFPTHHSARTAVTGAMRKVTSECMRK
jgi:hypothetical protein